MARISYGMFYQLENRVVEILRIAIVFASFFLQRFKDHN